MTDLYIIDGKQVRELLSMNKCIELVAGAMRVSSRGDAVQSLRGIMPLPGSDNACLGWMPGYLAEPECFGVKVTSVFPDNSGRNLQSHQGMVLLFDRKLGHPVAVVHGGDITAIRTAAASAVATRTLARNDASDLAILGYGEQAREHLNAMLLVRKIQRVRIWGRDIDKAIAFAHENSTAYNIDIEPTLSVQEAVSDADIVCTTTASPNPILNGDWIADGCHLNVVGSSVARFREIDDAAVARSRVYVDFLPMALAEGGELRSALANGVIDKQHILGELGDILNNECDGRQSENDITLYKSLGMPVQDLVSANYVYEQVRAKVPASVVNF